PLGTKGLVEVLRGLGGRVAISGDDPGSTTDGALLLSDDLTPDRRRGVLDWAARGGALVVADPSSGVTDVEQVGTTRIGLLDAELERRCPVPALAGVGRVSAPGGVVFGIPEGAGGRACFLRNDGAWLLVQPVGAGTVVRLGGASVLVNQNLGEADNGVLLASLLVPVEGTSIQVLQPPLPGGGTAGLGDLIAPRVRLALWQLVVAFALLALWRGRRAGRPGGRAPPRPPPPGRAGGAPPARAGGGGGGGAGRGAAPSRSSSPGPSWWWRSATCSSGPRAEGRRPGCSPTTWAAPWPSGWACPPRPRPTRWPTPSPPAPGSPASGASGPPPTLHPATRPSSSPSANPSPPSP